MKNFSFPAMLIAIAVLNVSSLSRAAESDEGLLGRLKQSQHSIADGVAQSQRDHGTAISAKFEMDGDTLMLSVYTAQAGLTKDAEHNVLVELIGDAGKGTWTPKIEVFEDKEHLKRSAMQLTLMQVSRLTLAEAIKAAAAVQPGTVYSVIPAVKGGMPVFDVKIATPEGKSVRVSIDAKSGKTSQ